MLWFFLVEKFYVNIIILQRKRIKGRDIRRKLYSLVELKGVGWMLSVFFIVFRVVVEMF